MSTYLPADLRRQVRAHFANCSVYCRTAEELTVAIFEFEHISTRSAGGKTVFENICFACPTCNRYKSDRTIAVDPHTQETVSLFHPHRDVWTDHFRWSGDATEIIGVTATGRATIAALKMNRPQLIRVPNFSTELLEIVVLELVGQTVAEVMCADRLVLPLCGDPREDRQH